MPEYDSTVSYRPIPSCPGYFAGSDGTIWSPDGKRVAAYKMPSGHLSANVIGRKKHTYVHRLVLEAFVGPAPEGMVCRHFPDRDPSNNRIENLQWGTRQENQLDRNFHGTSNKGSRHGMSKLTEDTVRLIRKDKKAGMKQTAIAKKYGVHVMTVSDITRGKAWTHVQ